MAVKTEESGFELLARLGSRIPLLGIAPHLFKDGPHPGEMYEFFGEEGTGKTEVLVNLVVSCTLPKVWKDVSVNGAEAKVIYISTDYKFSVLRLACVLEQRIRKIVTEKKPNSKAPTPVTSVDSSSPSSDQENGSNEGNSLEADVETLLQECLQRLHVIYCNSCQQLLITLRYLESQFVTDPAFSLLIIDPISTFYWIDKFVGNENLNQQGANIRRVTDILKRFVQKFSIITIATKSSIFKKRLPLPETDLPTSCAMAPKNQKPNYRYLDNQWENFISKRLTFTKNSSLLESSKFYIQRPEGNSVEFKITENGVEFL